MMVASGARTCSARHRCLPATLAIVLIVLGAVTSRAQASHLRQLVGSTTSFASDGVETSSVYAASVGFPSWAFSAIRRTRRTCCSGSQRWPAKAPGVV